MLNHLAGVPYESNTRIKNFTAIFIGIAYWFISKKLMLQHSQILEKFEATDPFAPPSLRCCPWQIVRIQWGLSINDVTVTKLRRIHFCQIRIRPKIDFLLKNRTCEGGGE